MASSFNVNGHRRPATAQSIGNGVVNLINGIRDNSNELKRIFNSINSNETNGDVLSTKDQLASALQQAGCNPSKKAVDDYWSAGGDQPVSLSRFREILEKENAATIDSEPLTSFRKLDPENTGKIAREQLRLIMTTKGEFMTNEEFSQIFDQSKFMIDETFDYIEFCKVVKKTLKSCTVNSMTSGQNGDGNNDYNIIERKIKTKERPKTCEPRFTNSSSNGPIFDKTNSNMQQTIWPRWQSRGNFHLDDGGQIISHQYSLELQTSSEIFITIEPILQDRQFGDVPVDCLIYILKDGDSGSTRQLASFTENRDDKGLYYCGKNLTAGRYKLQPFTSGCFFFGNQDNRDADNKSSLSNGSSRLPKTLIEHFSDQIDSSIDRLRLSDEYDRVLREIFKVIDLDGNGRLNRQEFSLFQWQSCGEEIQDDEWKALQDNFEMDDGELTLRGFLDVHLLEAENNEDDDSDIWKTLRAMGYNDQLKLVHMCPFLVTVYTEEAVSAFSISAMKSGGSTLEKAVCRSLIEIGVAKKIRNLNDLLLYIYVGSQRAAIAVQNKSHSSVSVRLDCTWSQNCLSHRGNLDYVLHLPPKTMKIGHYLVPQSENDPWKVVCTESVVRLPEP